MSKQAVLLVNLGSPDSPSVPDVRKYLREFLMDGRVLDTPYPLRFCVVHLAILPKRPQESAHAYQKVWTPQGSPLVVISKNVKAKLQARLSVPVGLAMRYQNPSIPDVINDLHYRGVSDLVVIPLFPHFAMSSFETAAERVKAEASLQAPLMKVRIAPPYYNDPDYITALVASAEDYLKKDYDHLLFSYHGIPERHLRKSDPTQSHCLQAQNCCEVASPAQATCYRAQCFQTTKAFVEKAGIPKEKYSISFQSRLGREPWLKPYTDLVLEDLPKKGVKKLLVICPAFVSDCLETIEEIGMRGRESFMQSGGTDYEQIPCMNEHPLWISALEKMSQRLLAVGAKL